MRPDCRLCRRSDTACMRHMIEDVLVAWRFGMCNHLAMLAILREEGIRP
jgi:hypothetical protein